MYTYNAIITAVYDGDTVTADVDLGMKVWVKGAKLRLAAINAPELRKPTLEAGRASRDYLRGLVEGQKVLIESIGRGKYGRWIVWIKIGDLNVNDELVKEGHAVKYP